MKVWKLSDHVKVTGLVYVKAWMLLENDLETLRVIWTGTWKENELEYERVWKLLVYEKGSGLDSWKACW